MGVSAVRKWVGDLVAGRPAKRAGDSAYAAAGLNSDATVNWHPSLGSADADLLPERDLTVARMRDVSRNNGWVAGVAQSQIDGTIGRGLRLVATPDWRSLGQTREWGQTVGREIERRWRLYTEDPGFWIDAARRRNLAGLLTTAHWSWFHTGEILALARWGAARPSPWRTYFQMVDSDRLSNAQGAPDSDRLRGGVELGPEGEPLAYHIRKAHPGEIFTAGARVWEWERVPRDTPHGRRMVIHAFKDDRPEQSRGKPPITSIIEDTRLLDRFEKNTAAAAVTQALYAAAFESPLDPALAADVLGGAGDVTAYQEARSEFHAKRDIRLNGVKIPHLFPGEQLKLTSPGQPGQTFEAFEATFLRRIAACSGQSYEQVSKDYSKTNYSSARAAMLETWKFYNGHGSWMEVNFANQIYALWLEEELDAGAIDVGSAPDFDEAKAAWCRCRWIGPGKGYIDPVKEAQAAKLRMDNGVSTLERECAEQGLDWEEVQEQRAREREFLAGLELPWPDAAQVVEVQSDDIDSRPGDTPQQQGA